MSTSISQPHTRRHRQPLVQLHYSVSGTPGYAHPRVNHVNAHSSPNLPSTYSLSAQAGLPHCISTDTLSLSQSFS